MPGGRLFLGVDVSERRGHRLAWLDDDLRVVALEQAADVAAVVTAVRRRQPDVVAVDASQRPGLHLMDSARYRARLAPRPRPGVYRGFRVCEWEVRRRGLAIYPTPRSEAEAPGWMRVGFALFRRLEEDRRLPRALDDTGASLLEAYPALSFTALAGGWLPPKSRPEGRLERLRLLAALGVRRAGGGPLRAEEADLDHDALDALVLAYTAWRYARAEAVLLGDPREGLLAAPVRSLPERWLRARASAGAAEAATAPAPAGVSGSRPLPPA
ncbi:MAG: DUF429 domain-containing protein [Bacillota bacterium]|nr:DUF429 domain-containing protein [Bacillota bacterium]